MSFSPLDVYGDMLSEEMTTKTNLINEETRQCIVSSKPERICDTLQVASEEIVVGANSLSLDKNSKTETTRHCEDSVKNCCDETIEYQRSIDSLSLTENSIVDNWDCENVSSSTLKDVEPENCNDEQDDSEETIATFVTAAGQQLALYAVEDSDEIFAVALYDESGEPPTNFQFLMKADVKRLIDEGAVRTLKKPAQMKKSVLTTESPVFYRKEDFGELHHQANYEIDKSLNDRKHVTQERDQEIGHNYEIGEAYSESIKFDSSFEDIDYTADKQSDIAYFMMDNNSENVDMSEQPDNNQDNYESEEEEELILCSTVQYIFLEGERPESDLTFDEIQETLQNSKHARRKKSSKKNNEKFIGNLKSDYSLNSREILRRGSSMMMNSLDEELDYYMSSQSTSRMCTSEDKSAEDRQRLIDALTDSPPSIDCQPQLKMKRSRKQQLTSVNRDDGEIIIQPASMLGEQEVTGKKRGRRRRGLASQMRVAATNTKRLRRKRREIVEVIDLDVEEEEPQTKSNVVEITIEDNKDKYSSDKENEIIMIRDSDSDNGDDEEDEEEDDDDDEHRSDTLTKFNGIMRCEHCSRNFKQRRAFDTHLRVCQKSPENLLRLSEKKQKDKEEIQQVKKQYACKICQEKFDVVVALARHVRAAHSQRKKHKLSLASPKIQDRSLRSVQQKEATSTEEEESLKDNEKPKREPSILSRVKRKRRQKNKCSWESKKLNCADCGRWFPSSALLNAHSLQHGTKKSEQLRKCYICKKLIRSRLLYLQHLKMHNDQRSSANSSRLLRRKLRGRPSARKIASPRKRGRPRKF